MNYIILAYQDEEQWAAVPAGERAFIQEACLLYEQEMRQSGYLFASETFQDSHEALTVQLVNGRIVLSEGGAADTKRQLIQLLFVSARDLNAAVKLVSNMPQIRKGPIEIRVIGRLVWPSPTD